MATTVAIFVAPAQCVVHAHGFPKYGKYTRTKYIDDFKILIEITCKNDKILSLNIYT